MEKKFSHIRILTPGIHGNYFGAFTNNKGNAKKGYTIFLSNKKEIKSYCECLGYIHGKLCYHLKEAKKLETLLFGKVERERE